MLCVFLRSRIDPIFVGGNQKNKGFKLTHLAVYSALKTVNIFYLLKALYIHVGSKL